MKIAVFGNYGVHNIGDDLILMGLRQKFPQDELTVYCGHPETVHRQFGLASRSFFSGGVRSWLKSLYSSKVRASMSDNFQTLQRMDLVLIGGGGILVDRHMKAVVLWWFQLRKIKKSGVPYCFIGNSLELQSWWSRRLFKPYLESAEFLSVRDRASQRLLKSMGITSEWVEDLSALAPLPSKPRQPERMIAISLCQWGIGQHQSAVLRRVVQNKIEEGYQVIGLAFQTREDDDRKILKKLFPEMKIHSEVSDILETMRTCEMLLAMRYHAVLLGLRLGVPTLALSYQEKVSNLMEDRNLSDWCISIQKIDEQNLQPLFLKAVEGGKK